jgi:hypothetical protein
MLVTGALAYERCRAVYGLSHLQDQGLLPYCGHYSGRTCCSVNDAIKIKHEASQYKADDVCVSKIAELQCSFCDPEIGTG